MLKRIRDLLRSLSEDQKVRFLLVGGYNTAFGYILFVVSYWFLSDLLHYVTIAVVVHFVAVTNSFITQRNFAFRSRAPWQDEFLRFQVTYLTMLPLGIGLLALYFDIIKLPMIAAQACATASTVFISYFVHLNFTFKNRTDA